MIKPKDVELLSTGVILRSPRQEGAGAALWSWPGGAEQLGGGLKEGLWGGWGKASSEREEIPADGVEG